MYELSVSIDKITISLVAYICESRTLSYWHQSITNVRRALKTFFEHKAKKLNLISL
jgi:hypothetical protein